MRTSLNRRILISRNSWKRRRKHRMQMQILDIKKLMDEKKEAVAAHMQPKRLLEGIMLIKKTMVLFNPVELIIAPIEAELKMHKNEIAAQQEGKKALERIRKS